LRVSWREILGLLIGLAICYGVISYALSNAPQIREVASEQKGKNAQPSETNQRTTSTASETNTKMMTIRITGSRGEPFGANYGNLRSVYWAEGVVPVDYEVQVSTDSLSGDYVSATAWKTTGNSKELKVQIIDNGKVLKEASTTKDYGAVGTRWSPNEPQTGGTTTTSSTTEKTAGENGKSKP
jgi:hypothetical protein